MNNAQSLPVIFWCFIVLITRCFSHHLLPKSRVSSLEGFGRDGENVFLQKWPHFVGCLPSLLVIRSFFCCFPLLWLLSDFPPFTISAQLHRPSLFLSVHDREMRALHVLLLCHISRPLLLNQPPRGGIRDCKDINMASTTTAATVPHTPAHFSHPISFHWLFFIARRDSHFMKCFDGTIFELTWSKCIKCNSASSFSIRR